MEESAMPLAWTAYLPAMAMLAAAPSGAGLSDAHLRAFAAAPYDKAAKFNKTEVLGLYHGARVVVEYPCSDVCPDYTVRIIHFDLMPGPTCNRFGGKSVVIMVPVSIAVMRKPCCVPAIIAGHLEAYDPAAKSEPSPPRGSKHRHRRRHRRPPSAVQAGS